MHMRSLVASTILLTAYAAPVDAAARIQSGVGPNGMTWTATNYIVGTTSTGTTPPDGSPSTAPGGGNPIYLAPNRAGYSGVVGLLITADIGGGSSSTFTCSGTLVGDRSVVTAGHCVSFGGGVKASDIIRTQVFFQDDASSDRDEAFVDLATGNPPAGVTAIDVSNYIVNAGYTGEVVDQNDIAVLTLAQIAPSFAQRYELYTDDIKGQQFNVTGYGKRSSVGGEDGTTIPYGSSPGYRRQGDNVFDYAWGDPAFNGLFTDRGPHGYHYTGSAENEYSYLADFDSGDPAQDTSCRFAIANGVSAADADSAGFCTLGVGALEAMTAHGDSGGGSFIGGRLASVTSYGLNASSPDMGGAPNSGFADLAGYVPIFIHTNFIRNAIASAVPEPTTWAQMLLGFGMIGAASRRRVPQAVAAA